MRAQHIEKIREACIKANKEIGYKADAMYRPIRLADVLLAIDAYVNRVGAHEEGYYIDHTGNFGRLSKWPEKADWNLRKDTLEDQTDETVAFIHSLIA